MKDDLISRQAAIAIEFTNAINEDGVIYVPLREYLSGIESLSSAQPEVLACGSGELNAQHPQLWIPCSERLPECNGVYEVTMRCEDGLYESACYFDGQDTWHNDNRVNFDRPFVTDRVIAWMPLPEPYKAEREEV